MIATFEMSMPTDSLFVDKFFLNDISAPPVWHGDSGQGVKSLQFWLLTSNDTRWRLDI